MTSVTSGIIDTIAKVCHDANKAFCETNKDWSQFSWEVSPEWQKESCRAGVKYPLDNPNSAPSDSHNNWLKVKQETGWVYGTIKDAVAVPPTHPCIVPFEQLPDKQKMKDFIFQAICHGMAKGYGIL